jgi:CHAT domain-containing protein/Tfp pilus assembly protein PilF
MIKIKLFHLVISLTLFFAVSSLFPIFVNANPGIEGQKTLRIINDNEHRRQQNAIPLIHGKPIGRKIREGETHYYQITLTKGQYLRVKVEQHGVDLAIVLGTPKGVKLLQADEEEEAGAENAAIVADADGAYQFLIYAKERDISTPGSYKAEIIELRAATTFDKKHAAAMTLFYEASEIFRQGTAESYHEAINKLQALIPFWQSIGDKSRESHTLLALAMTYGEISEMQKAREYLERALPLAQSSKNQKVEAFILTQLGNNYLFTGESQLALTTLERAMQIIKELDKQTPDDFFLTLIGRAYQDLGEWQKALDHYQRALKAIRAELNRTGTSGGNLTSAAGALNNISLIYQSLGDRQQAIEYSIEALQYVRQLDDKVTLAGLLTNLGYLYAQDNKRDKALQHLNEALTASRATDNKQSEIAALNVLAILYLKSDTKQKGLEYANQALNLARKIGDRNQELSALNTLGLAYESSNNIEGALNYLNLALLIARGIADKSVESRVRFALFRVERKRGDFVSAAAHIEASLEIIESTRSKLANQNLRGSFFASAQDQYEQYIDFLMQLHKQQPTKGYNERALQASERARARLLIETLTEANANVRQGVDPILLERERSIQQLLAGKSERLTRISNDEKLKGQKPAAEKEVNDLLAQYQEIQAQIRVKSPRYASLTQPVPANLAEIQQLLDKDTVLLEYALGEERSYLWLITRQSLKSYELPKRSRIEELVNRFITGITGQNNVPASNKIEYQKQQAYINQAKSDYPQTSLELGKILLGQVVSEIAGKRLLIVGDGVLQYVPFAALPKPINETVTAAVTEPLIASNEIVNLPSASTLVILRREEFARRNRKPYTKTVAVFADPVFDTGDSRYVSDAKNSGMQSKPAASRGQNQKLESNAPVSEPETTVLRSATEVGLADRGSLRRLLDSKQEAEAIRGATPTGQTMIAMGFDASRERVMTSNLAEYRIVHFATHGLLNEEHPELSGVVLSLIDEQGKPQNGFLRLHEIYNLNLPVEMVVLSACQTGLGKKVKGEGLVGLTRGFMYAGAPRVVASLWSVDDTATAELMSIFYRKMLREDLPPATALRAAQNELRQKHNRKPPYYWAGFVLQGDWQNFRETPRSNR